MIVAVAVGMKLLYNTNGIFDMQEVKYDNPTALWQKKYTFHLGRSFIWPRKYHVYKQFSNCNAIGPMFSPA